MLDEEGGKPEGMAVTIPQVCREETRPAFSFLTRALWVLGYAGLWCHLVGDLEEPLAGSAICGFCLVLRSLSWGTSGPQTMVVHGGFL